MKIQDYLHLYLGCTAMITEGSTVSPYNLSSDILSSVYAGEFVDVKPILRPLSDMTDEESREICAYTRNAQAFVKFDTPIGKEAINPLPFKYLLSKHFDLFGLIEAGLALNAKQLNH